jgi:NADPH:quinone reductase-like Zn-dependent oxidoreductase
MKAIVIDSYGGSEKLQLAELARPEPQDHELLIRVRAAGVNPLDWKLRQGQMRLILRLKFPYVPGSEVAGEVAAVGNGVAGLAPGDAVFAFIDPKRGGGYAEYATARDSAAAAKPSRLSFVEAATLPIAGCTALQALRDHGRLEAGGHVLILGGAGGVGHFAVQIAKARGAAVTATCGPDNLEYVRSLGADTVLDYHWVKLAELPDRYDVVFDAVGKSSFAACAGVLAPGGTYVTTMPSPQVVAASGVQRVLGLFGQARQAKFVMVRANTADLAWLSRLAEDGGLRPTVSRVYPLESAAEAQEASRSGHTRGKLVLEG